MGNCEILQQAIHPGRESHGSVKKADLTVIASWLPQLRASVFYRSQQLK